MPTPAPAPASTPRLQETSAALLSFLSLAVPHEVQAAQKRTHSNSTPPPLRLAQTLSDGVLLAYFTSVLSPGLLPSTKITRIHPRNALSAPPVPDRRIQLANVDARQRDVQYRSNTRRVLAAVKLLLAPCRDPAKPPVAPAVVDAFVGDVAATPPTLDLRPALRLALLVVAAAVYGPTQHRFAPLFWQLPSDAARTAFHRAMTSVSNAVLLPPPDRLYADAPGHSSPPGAAYTSLTDSRGLKREAGVPPLVDPGLRLSDDGLGPRKFSMVTNESRDTMSPTGFDSPLALRSPTAPITAFHSQQQSRPTKPAPSQIPPVVDNEFVRSMQDLEVQHAAPAQNSTHGERNGSRTASHSTSDEFFTPREHSPSPDRSHDDQYVQQTSAALQAPIADPQAVDETVRQSVTSSIKQQIANQPEALSPPPRPARPVLDFTDPSYMSPSGSEAPEPSNQWQISRQKAMAAAISSPQQLYSPPQMPRRLSRATAAPQMTPPPAPAPQLFRAPSPHLSVSSNGGANSIDDSEEVQQLGRQRVSFAPNIISPGGNLRPLGQPLRPAERDSITTHSSGGSASQGSPRSRDPSFSLPPCAAGGVVGTSQGAEQHEDGEFGGVFSGSSGQQEDYTAERYDDVEGDRGEGEGEQNQYVDDGEDRDFDDDEDGHDSREDVEESSSSEKDSFERVEEYVITSSDQEDAVHSFSQKEHSQRRDLPPPQIQEDLQHVSSGNDHPQSEVVVAPVENVSVERPVPLSLAQKLPEESPGNVFEEISAMQAKGLSSLSPVQSPRIGSPMARRGSSSRSYPREVPPTPPSPPALAALVESITERKPTAKEMDPRPVSTMAPSAELFQKLITVWQNSDDGGRQATSREIQPESLSSTHDSTLPSGDTDIVKAAMYQQTGKSRRPRAIRLEPGAPTPQDMERLDQADSGRPDQDERESVVSKGSVASFSDAFSSDKERNWLYSGGTQGDGYDWEEAMKGDLDAGIPDSPSANSQEEKGSSVVSDARRAVAHAREVAQSREKPPLPPSPRSSSRKSKSRSHSTSTRGRGVETDGEHIRVDRRRLDWLTRELLSARDVISRQELQMTFAETQRMEQEEVLLLDKQNAESVVDAMKHILTDREKELNEARSRLSFAIQSVSRDRGSVGSRSSAHGESENLSKLITEGNQKLHSRIAESDAKRKEAMDEMSKESWRLWEEVQRAMIEKMSEMTEKRDAELDILRRELEYRQKLIDDLQKSGEDLRSKNQGFHSEVAAMRVEQEKSKNRYQLEMAHVGAQVELVNEFSKKLHDNFRETENLRQQVLQYQDKLTHITSTSGVSQRQIKELREAVTRANDECARLRREADFAKRKGMEAVRRAEELEELRHKDVQVMGRFPDRQDPSDTASYRSHEPVRPPGQNRPGGTGTAARYHVATRSRGIQGTPSPAQKTWLAIKDKISGIVTGNQSSSSRRRGISGPTARRDASRASSGTHSSVSNSRSRQSPREDDMIRRAGSGSARSRSSNGSSIQNGIPRSPGNGGRVSPSAEIRQYMHDSPRARAPGIAGITAVDF